MCIGEDDGERGGGDDRGGVGFGHWYMVTDHVCGCWDCFGELQFDCCVVVVE